MKKIFSVFFAVLLISAVTLTGTSCGTTDENTVVIDPNKKQVYVSVFNGGFGSDWLQQAADNFNAENPKTQIIIDPNRDNYNTIYTAISSGAADCDVYFTNDSQCINLAAPGYLEDLTDLWDMETAEGEETVRGKMRDPEVFASAYTYNDKLYGVPISEGLHGFIYDHDLVKPYLKTQADGSLSLGKDGELGTYDDGLPVDMAEWDELIAKLVAAGIRPFSWTGAAASDYLAPFGETIFAQYEGLTNYKLAATFSGTYTDPETKKTTQITPAEGYKTYPLMKGRLIAAEYMQKYFFSNELYYTPSSQKPSTTYRSAQDYFITGYKGASSNPRAAMLYEGIWWENEARSTFLACKEPGMGYGERDFRLMPFPDIPNQMGGNGNGTGSVIAVSENGTAFIRKQSDPEKLDAAKRFIAYTLSDEMLRLFTRVSGTPKPYYYTLEKEDLDAMTKFARNVWEVYSDSENIKLARYQIMNAASPLFYAATPPASRWQSTAKGQVVLNLYGAMFSNISPSDYFAGMATQMSAENWAKSYNTVKSFYE